jgi:hypothetical protein
VKISEKHLIDIRGKVKVCSVAGHNYVNMVRAHGPKSPEALGAAVLCANACRDLYVLGEKTKDLAAKREKIEVVSQ